MRAVRRVLVLILYSRHDFRRAARTLFDRQYLIFALTCIWESAPQSDSITPENPHSLRSTVLDIHPFAQEGVPLMASYAHIAEDTLASSMICSGTMYVSAMSCTDTLPLLCSRFFEPQKKTQRERLHLQAHSPALHAVRGPVLHL